MDHLSHAQAALACTLLVAASAAAAEPEPQSLSDAWWTGPLLAPSAATLPRGHLYVEPYLFDTRPYAHLDSAGHPHQVPREDDVGSLTYINYGLTDRLTVGVVPHFGYVWAPDGGSSNRPGAGDVTVQAQYSLTQFRPGSLVPDFALNLQESVPAGRYDRLQGARDGFGSGAWTTTLGAYVQSYFWMPNGRIVRVRLDLSYALPDQPVPVDGQSVYGTSAGFGGSARPGHSAVADLAFEHSVTRNWVLACDVWLERDGSTRVSGHYPQPPQSGGHLMPYFSVSGPSRTVFVAPALEYNWSGRAGIIVGTRITVAGRNEQASVTAVAAFSYFL